MILITVVENIFKHGDLQNKNEPAIINCEIDEVGKQIIFTAVNKKNAVKQHNSTGVGIKNIQQRLSLLYGNKGLVQTFDKEKLFETQLVMPYFETNKTTYD